MWLLDIFATMCFHEEMSPERFGSHHLNQITLLNSYSYSITPGFKTVSITYLFVDAALHTERVSCLLMVLMISLIPAYYIAQKGFLDPWFFTRGLPPNYTYSFLSQCYNDMMWPGCIFWKFWLLPFPTPYPTAHKLKGFESHLCGSHNFLKRKGDKGSWWFLFRTSNPFQLKKPISIDFY